MKIEWSTMMVRSLKGAPISILIIMMLNPQPVNAQFLERSTGYGHDTIGSALLLLQDFGLITRNGRYSWQLAGGVTQLPIMVPEIEDSESAKVDNSTPAKENGIDREIIEVVSTPAMEDKIDREKIAVRSSKDEKDCGKIEVPPSSSSCINKNLESVKPQLLDSGPADSGNFGVAENRAECDRFGIREPAKSKLSGAEHVTSLLIRYHCVTAPNTGAAIYRIEHDWKIKPGWIDPDMASVGAQTIEPETPETPEDLPDAPIWEEVRGELQEVVSKAEFNTWIASCRMMVIDPEENRFLLRSGNSFGAGWITQHALGMILEKTTKLTGRPAEIEVGW